MTDWEALTALQIIDRLRDTIVAMGQYVAGLESEALETERSVAFWTEEARRYAGNADYWRARTTEAERVIQAARAMPGHEPTEGEPMWCCRLQDALATYDQWRKGGSDDRVASAEPTSPGGPAAQDRQGAGPG